MLTVATAGWSNGAQSQKLQATVTARRPGWTGKLKSTQIIFLFKQNNFSALLQQGVAAAELPLSISESAHLTFPASTSSRWDNLVAISGFCLDTSHRSPEHTNYHSVFTGKVTVKVGTSSGSHQGHHWGCREEEESDGLAWQNLDTTCQDCRGQTDHCHVCTRVPCTGHSGWRMVRLWDRDFQDRTKGNLCRVAPTPMNPPHTSILKYKQGQSVAYLFALLYYCIYSLNGKKSICEKTPSKIPGLRTLL